MLGNEEVVFSCVSEWGWCLPPPGGVEKKIDRMGSLRLRRSRSGCTQLFFGEASTIGRQRTGHQVEILDSPAAEISDDLAEAGHPAVMLGFALQVVSCAHLCENFIVCHGKWLAFAQIGRGRRCIDERNVTSRHHDDAVEMMLCTHQSMQLGGSAAHCRSGLHMSLPQAPWGRKAFEDQCCC
jgi:hypothetical protein